MAKQNNQQQQPKNPEAKTDDQTKNSNESSQPKPKYFGKFRVKRGFHNEGGATYGVGSEAGDTLDSMSDLTRLGKDKFELLVQY